MNDFSGMSPGEISKRFNISAPDAVMVANGKRRLDQVKSEWTYDELKAYDFPPLKWIVPKYILSEGLIWFGGRPKVGKSWMVLQLIRDISAGGVFFNEQCAKRSCYYLCLEDGMRRISERTKLQNWGNHQVTFNNEIGKKLDKKGGLSWLEKSVMEKGFNFVVIDTFSRAISGNMNQSNNSDVQTVLDGLQNMAVDYNACILMIDHLNKLYKDQNVVDGIMGATAKSATSDEILGLRRDLNKTEGTLELVPRDGESKKLSVEFDKDNFVWNLVGETDELIKNRSEQKLIRAIESLDDNATSDNIMNETGWSKSYLSRIARELIAKDRLHQIERGKPYRLVLSDNDKVIADIISNGFLG